MPRNMISLTLRVDIVDHAQKNRVDTRLFMKLSTVSTNLNNITRARYDRDLFVTEFFFTR